MASLKHQRNTLKDRVASVYNETVTDHVMNPRNHGEMVEPSGVTASTKDGDEYVRFWLKVIGTDIGDISFTTNACAATVACASMATCMLKGATASRAWALTGEDIVGELGGLPEGNHHNAGLVVASLRSALRDSAATQRDPWKQAYRRH